MKVKTRLYLSSIIIIGLVAILLFGVFLISNKIINEIEKNHLAHEIHMAVSELNIVTYEYLMYHEKRMEQQWNLKYNSTVQIMEKAVEEQIGEKLIELVGVQYTALGRLFSQVTANYSARQKFIQEGVSKEKIESAVLLEERLIVQLLIKSQSIITDASRLEDEALLRITEAQKLEKNLISTLMTILVITVIITSLVVVRSISKPLDKLIEGVEIIGKGNRKHKIDIKSKDEFAQLAIVFNKMTTELKESYESLEQKVKKRTIELEKAKNESEILLASIGDGVFAINRERNIIHFNRAAEKLSGYKSSEVVGKPYYDVLRFVKEKDKSEEIAFIRKAFKGELSNMENGTVLIRKDQSELQVADSAAPLKDKKGEVLGVIVTFRDVTKGRKIQQMRSEFMSLASHELKSPLTIMRIYMTELADKTLGQLTKEQQRAIDIAIKASDRLLKLTNELLDVSRLEDGRVKTEPLVVDPIDLAKKAITEELRQAFKQKKQKFTFKKPESLPKIKVDPKFIITPIQNLLSNASKYTPDKGEIKFEVSKSKDRILFRITDSGIGIPKKEQFKLFQRFFRASNVVYMKQGTGLGLYMTKLMIELSGGRIWFESEENKGTIFYFSLPALKRQKYTKQ